jgi:hypothetical protein
MLALQTPSAARTPEQNAAVFSAWRASLADAKPINDEIDVLWNTYPVAATSILHLAELEPANRRKTFLLDRGNWDQPLRVVEPHVPAALHSFAEDLPRNRLGFARWLTDPRSPLTARVAVNRIWQASSGGAGRDGGVSARGRGSEYRGLDWLAVDFMEQGWPEAVDSDDRHARVPAVVPAVGGAAGTRSARVWLAGPAVPCRGRGRARRGSCRD